MHGHFICGEVAGLGPEMFRYVSHHGELFEINNHYFLLSAQQELLIKYTNIRETIKNKFIFQIENIHKVWSWLSK